MEGGINIDKSKQIQLLKLQRQKRILEAREDFWSFCKAIAPDFYKEERIYLKNMCNTLQALYERKLINKKTNKPYKNLALSIPPRFGKSRTVGLFTSWLIGKNIQSKIMTCSYNEDIGTTFSRNCRETILAKSEEIEICFNDIFPNTQIKKGNSSVNNWSVEGGYNTYYGGGFGSSFTGRGADIIIIDDPIKNAEEALNETRLEQIYNTYTDTLMSRLEGDGLTIIIQTRWSKKDLIGRVLGGEDRENWFELSLQAYNEEKDIMLCDEILPKDKYVSLKKSMSDLIFLANYQQKTIDLKGALYSDFKRYEDFPKDKIGNVLFENIVAFVDTADTGSDYLAMIIAGVYQKQLYILDIVYSQEKMEVTENLVIDALYQNRVNVCIVESNNGGKGFARRLQDLQIEKYKTNHTVIKWKAQTRNKQTRILMNAPWILENVYFPLNAKSRWEEAWEHLITFSKSGKNKHDDIEDCLTALAENFGDGCKVINRAKSFKLCI